MKNFIYKLILTIITIVISYQLTIGDDISNFKNKFNTVLTKEGRKDTVNKLREELQKAIKKEEYLSKEDAILINAFLNKIKKELEEAKN